MAKSNGRSGGNPRRRKTEARAAEAESDRLNQSIDYDKWAESPVFEGPTGRLLGIVPAKNSKVLSSAVAKLRSEFSLKHVYNSADSAAGMSRSQMDSADMIVFQNFGIVVIKSDPDQRVGVMSAAQNKGMIVEREYWRQALGMPSAANIDADIVPRPAPGGSLEYFRGFRDALTRVIDAIEPGADAVVGPAAVAANFADSAAATWGLQATGVIGSNFTGAGVRVAILDSGFKKDHPDFVGRTPTSKSFIESTIRDKQGNLITLNDLNELEDRSGHGTHCIGTACGPRIASSGPRFGIAHGAEIFNGKVLTVPPSGGPAVGADGWIIAGIHWAIQNQCSIISMSLGGPPRSPEDKDSKAYEAVAKDNWNSVLIIAAAGNDSARSLNFFRPVTLPASCPHIVSVAAVDRTSLPNGHLRLANFSNRHMIDDGGEINFAGPGVAVRSSYNNPLHQFLDGTSQATPHVAGIAALVQQQTGKKGEALYLELRNRAIVQGARVDYGNGLIHV